jgi:hypothetical protein
MIDILEFKTIDGISYKRNKWGGITQVYPKPFKYNQEYNATYDTEAYRAGSLRLSEIRWSMITDVIKEPAKVLDFGYGNGAFLDYIADKTKAFGYDVATGYEGEEWQRVESLNASYDVVCFWDSLEHCKNLSFVKYLKTKYIAISLPFLWCDTVQEFNTFKHRKPDEHIHHFDAGSLVKFFEDSGYKLRKLCFVEDEVRASEQSKNIISGVFEKIV